MASTVCARCATVQSALEFLGEGRGLNIPRYVHTFEAEPEIDIKVVQKKIKGQLTKTRIKMAKYLKEIGL